MAADEAAKVGDFDAAVELLRLRVTDDEPRSERRSEAATKGEGDRADGPVDVEETRQLENWDWLGSEDRTY